MKKSDLKTGMWVKYRNGEMRMVLLDSVHGDVLVSDNNYGGQVKNIKDNLTHTTFGNLDIIEVWKPKRRVGIIRFYEEDFELIWKREEAIEVSQKAALAILEQYFGKKVKIIEEE